MILTSQSSANWIDGSRVGISLRLAPALTLGFVLSAFFPGANESLAKDSAAKDSAGAVNDQSADGNTFGAQRNPDPIELIQAMSLALNNLNYEGIFVHAQGVNLTSMHIVHSSDENGELERLRALDGEAREVIRNDSLVTCVWPDSQSVVVSKSKPRDLLPRVDAGIINNQRYVFSLHGRDRVAGRATFVVDVTPRDQYRYGYRFWIDQLNSMLLRSLLLEGTGNPVEQIIFTQIQFPAKIDKSLFDPGTSGERISWLEPKRISAAKSLDRNGPKNSDRVLFQQLPQGYEKISETFSSIPIKSGSVSHVMLSDGMASVSVYVEYVAADRHTESALGLSRMGAMNAFGRSTPGALITAVGEVPAATVRSIAAAVQLRE
ncbi:MAG: MucB/RseB C-terminal domain-containing protein [Granulosicoccus sp.]|nr:MucB/RseB C-terminal domain-containing protein [Granulosicoccus sp.]